MTTPEEKGVATLDRALAILSTFETQPSLSLAEISRRTGLYKSTLLRLLSSFEKAGYIGQQADGNYHVGVAALHLGSLYQRWIKPSELVMPALTRLVGESGESASFNVREGDVRVCVYRVDSPQKIRDHVRVGDILPLGIGAAGKVMTAFDTEPQASQWDGVRNAFFCATSGEIEPDTAAVAAPVFGIGDRFEGALAVTGPAFRFSAEKVAAMRRPLLEAALGLTRDFGGGVGRLEMALAKLKVDQG